MDNITREMFENLEERIFQLEMSIPGFRCDNCEKPIEKYESFRGVNDQNKYFCSKECRGYS